MPNSHFPLAAENRGTQPTALYPNPRYNGARNNEATVSTSLYTLNMEFKNSLINKYGMVLPKQHYCKYIYIYVIFEVFDPGHLFTVA